MAPNGWGDPASTGKGSGRFGSLENGLTIVVLRLGLGIVPELSLTISGLTAAI